MKEHIIYFLKQKTKNRVKIGSTTNFEQRVRKLEVEWGSFDDNSEVCYLNYKELTLNNLSLDNVEKTIQRLMKSKNLYLEISSEEKKDGSTEFFHLDEVALKEMTQVFMNNIDMISSLKSFRRLNPLSNETGVLKNKLAEQKQEVSTKTAETTQLYKLKQFDNINEDILFWYKKFLVFKLATLNQTRVKDDFDIAKHFNQIRSSSSIEDIRNVANEVKPNMGAFYGIANGLIRFYEFLPSMDLKCITEITNSIFYNDFLGKHLNGSSQSLIVSSKSAVKQLFDFIELHNTYYKGDEPYLFYLTRDSNGKAIPLQQTKKSKIVPVWLSENELKELNKSILKYKGYKKKTYEFDKARNILIMKILIYSGITASELVNLKIEDVKEIEVNNKKYIELNIKNSNNQDRAVPIPRAKIIRYLNAYLEVRDNNEVDYLFYSASKKDRQMKTQFVLNVVKDYIDESEIVKRKVTTEILRNSHAILLGNLGAEPLYVKDRLGYKTMTATKEILKNCNRKTLKAVNKFAMTDKYL